MPASELWFVVPGDPGQNTGGYRYVRRLVEALAKPWPRPDQGLGLAKALAKALTKP